MFSIGVLARRAGCSVPTVRYYEGMGLMPAAERRSGGHRVYGRSDLARLVFIRRCREFDVPLERIQKMMTLFDGERPCAETRDLFQTQRQAVQARIRALQELDFTLSLYVSDCEAQCLPAAGPCDLFERLSET